MKKIILLLTFTSQWAFAEGDIDVTIDWVENVARSSVLEVCGKAVSKAGKWPLVVSIVHGDSKFSTLTGPDGKYCQLVGRQTFKGEVNVTATSMDRESSGFKSLKIR